MKLPKELQAHDWNRFIRSGYRVFISGGAATPQALMRRFLAEYAEKLHSVELIHFLTVGPTPWLDRRYSENLSDNAFFLSQGTRESANAGLSDYTPCFASEIPRLMDESVLPIDTALISVDAVLSKLKHRNDLGIHSEMISDGMMQLLRSGNINNSRKTQDRGLSVTSFALGS